MEIIYWLRHGCEAGDDRSESFHDIFPHLEMGRNAVDLEPSQHEIKTHLNPSFFQRQLKDPGTSTKFVVVMRDIKDLIVSYYFFHKMVTPTAFGDRDFQEFFQKFKEGSLVFGDPIEYNLAWWQFKDHPNVHIVFYEDLLTDGVEQIQAIGDFLGRPVTEETAERIQRGCSFGQMSQRGLGMYQKELMPHMYDELRSRFFRKGVSGDWKNHFSTEQARYVDDLVKERRHPTRPVWLNEQWAFCEIATFGIRQDALL